MLELSLTLQRSLLPFPWNDWNIYPVLGPCSWSRSLNLHSLSDCTSSSFLHLPPMLHFVSSVIWSHLYLIHQYLTDWSCSVFLTRNFSLFSYACLNALQLWNIIEASHVLIKTQDHSFLPSAPSSHPLWCTHVDLCPPLQPPLSEPPLKWVIIKVQMRLPRRQLPFSTLKQLILTIFTIVTATGKTSQPNWGLVTHAIVGKDVTNVYQILHLEVCSTSTFCFQLMKKHI